jgi:hypothetical protein
MSGRGNREAALRADATAWRDRIIADAESAEGRAAARAHQVSVELVGEAATMIAAYIARGEHLASRADTIGALVGPGQARRVVRYLEARGHIERGADRDLFRIRGEMDRDPSAVN